MMIKEEKLRRVIRSEIKKMVDEAQKPAKHEVTDVGHHAFVSKQIGNVLGSTERAITELRSRKKENDSQYIDEGIEILRSVAERLREW